MRLPRKLVYFAISVFVFIAISFHASADSALSVEAQEALDKGVIAAKIPDYLLAIRYFKTARILAPDEPVIYLNMGLAESAIAGRELRAMAWFGAYLTAVPQAQNAAAVKEQVGLLEVRSQSNLARLIKAAEETAAVIHDADDKSHAQYAIAEVQLEAGDFSGAKKTLSSALKTADLMQDTGNNRKWSILIDISRAQLHSGNISGAKAALGSAINALDYIKGASEIRSCTNITVRLQADLGDISGAQKTIEKVQDKNNGDTEISWSSIAEAQAKAGKYSDAMKTSEIIKDGYWKSYTQSVIAAAQAKSGDISGAKKTFSESQKTADKIINADSKKYAQRDLDLLLRKSNIANESMPVPQSASGEKPSVESSVKVSDWLQRLDDENISNPCPLNTEPFLDISAYLKSLSPSAYASSIESIYGLSRKIAGSQKIINQMMSPLLKK